MWTWLFISLVACVAPLISASGDHHKTHVCNLCECFVKYEDRDIWIPKSPYEMAAVGYDTQEDECLALCLRDDRCSAAVYGLVGGREIYTCELYEDTDPTGGPRYTPNLNAYIKRRAMPCMVNYDSVRKVETIAANNEPEKRKKKYIRLLSQRNPFYWGRR